MEGKKEGNEEREEMKEGRNGTKERMEGIMQLYNYEIMYFCVTVVACNC